MFCLRSVLKNPKLVSSNNQTRVQIGLTGLDEIFTSCDTVPLLLICKTVWNKLYADHLLSQIFIKNGMNRPPVNVLLIFHKVERHWIVIGHKFTNFSNCFGVSSSRWSPTTWVINRFTLPSHSHLTYSKKCVGETGSSPQTFSGS